MRILITNDDGIDAEGLRVLFEIAAQFTAPKDIMTIAPATDQSGVGHCISYKKSVRVDRPAPNRLIVHGTPADCVIVGLLELNNACDLILSGVNAGNNAGQNVMYSGTVGAAIEGCANGINSIALSQFYGDGLGADMFSAAREFGEATVRKILNFNCWESQERGVFYNVNFPPLPASAVLGSRISVQGRRPSAPFTAEADGQNVRILGTPQHQATAKGSDVFDNLNGFISITPCLMDLTATDTLGALAQKLEAK